ncbi:hypothetical protein psyc5s11_50700 [Clostridium gelidum]|uniref:Class I SAM-dependent methyltransferase n=1 Tax=Clostridium gelidum TaxID=704125 RepID=A0ABM7TCF1_9CLOT|nr:class I SAM-dependent methyltransferase [Clostridium gelidum]BCZ49003.1 hypothetical protein psyc5s11_50700 [Clostridium gelidum]
MDKINKQLKEHYNNYYDDGMSEWRYIGAKDKTENIIKLCIDYPHNKILEIGCGEGSILEVLSKKSFGKNLYGIDISASGVQVASKRNIPNLAECQVYDGYNVPYESDYFDLVILTHVIEHVEYPRKLLYEASRVAKYVFVEVPLEDNIRGSNNFIFDKTGHINFYSKKTIRKLIQSCNLNIYNELVTNPSYETYEFENKKANFFIKELMLKFLSKISTSIFTYHNSILCSKLDLTNDELHSVK